MKWWIAALVSVAAVIGPGAARASAASTPSPVSESVRINGHAVTRATQGHSIRLDPHGTARIELSIANPGPGPLTVRSVQLAGSVIGLTFYSFDTSVDLTVPAGSSSQLSYTLDLTGLDGQATGLIPSRLSLYGPDRRAIVSQPFIADVRGSLRSVYGLFGLAVLILTLLALVDVALSIALHRMPVNRWRRGLRTMTPGIGIGLILVFTLSADRIWVPLTSRWIVVAATFAVGFLLVGYLSPNPDPGDDETESVIDVAALVAAATISPRSSTRTTVRGEFPAPSPPPAQQPASPDLPPAKGSPLAGKAPDPT